MKTSNKLLVAALALVLGTVVTYDVTLRAEYRTGRYKDPLANFTKLAQRRFDEVEIPAGAVLNVDIAAGPTGVWVSKDAATYIRLEQQGRRLTVVFSPPREEQLLGGRRAVIIHCPQLRVLTTGSGAGSAANQAIMRRTGYAGEVFVRNFNQDSLRIAQHWAGSVKLEGNTLRQLRAVAGTGVGSRAQLEIAGNNRIQAADLAVNHQGKLALRDRIPQLRYQFSDSAVVTFGGAAAAALAGK